LRVNGLGSKNLRFARPMLGDAEVRAVKAEGKDRKEDVQAMHWQLSVKAEDQVAAQAVHEEMTPPDEEKTETACEPPEHADIMDGRSSRGTEVWFDASDVAA
jgi:hypothetical protein